MTKIDGLNTLIETAYQNKSFLSASYGLYINKKSYLNYFGYLQEDNKKGSDDNTLFDCASLSKVVVTTTLILMMQEKGLLRLYDTVSQYIPDFKHKKVTLYDLLTHTSGLLSDVYSVANITDRDELLKIIYQMPLIYPTGEKIVYSDIGFILLGFVLEKISGKALDILAKEWLFEPLDMIHSCYNPIYRENCAPTEMRNDPLYKGRVQGFVHDETAFLLGGVAGHAGLFSTCSDLLNFLQMILNEGLYKNKKILHRASINLLFSTMVEEKNGINCTVDKRSIGYIVKGSYPSCGELCSPNTIYHTGFTGCNLIIDRDNRLCFVFLSNRVYYGRENMKLIDLRPRLGNYIIANLLEESI